MVNIYVGVLERTASSTHCKVRRLWWARLCWLTPFQQWTPRTTMPWWKIISIPVVSGWTCESWGGGMWWRERAEVSGGVGGGERGVGSCISCFRSLINYHPTVINRFYSLNTNPTATIEGRGGGGVALEIAIYPHITPDTAMDDPSLPPPPYTTTSIPCTSLFLHKIYLPYPDVKQNTTDQQLDSQFPAMK